MAMPSITISTSAVMLVLLLMTSALAFPTKGGDTAGLAAQGLPSGAANLHFPVGPVEHRPAAAVGAVAASGPLKGPPFRHCEQCLCCRAGNPDKCAMMPCCYGINCNLPGKPFGQCSFVPIACNCDSCA